MKKSTMFLPFVLAAILLTMPLSGCGPDEGRESAAPSASGDGKVWAPDFVSLPGELGAFNCTAFSGGSAYVASTGIVKRTVDTSSVIGGSTTSTSSSFTDAQPRIYKVSTDGRSYEALPDYVPMNIPEGSEGTVSIDALCADGEGNLWVCEEAYKYHYDLPEGFSGSEEEKSQYYMDDGRQYAVRKLSPTGAELQSTDLSDIAGESDYFYINGMACDKDGNVYFSDGNTTLYVYGKDGSQLFTLEVPNYIYSVIALSDGTVGVGSSGMDGYEVIPADVSAKAWGESVEMSYPDALYSGAGDYYFFYSVSSSLYGYNRETGGAEKLFGWLDCDIDQSAVRALTALEDGFVCVCDDDGGGSVATISQKEASSMPQKTTLTLATMSLDYALRKQILKFNKTNDAHRIEVRDYSEYNTGDDYTAGMTKLSTEIISGNVPDMIDVSQLPAAQFASRGLLEDLYPYIDADPELSRGDFVPSIMKALEIDGGLYQASPSFGIFTVIGRSDVVGDEMGWTMDEMMACLAGRPEGTELFQPGITQDTMLQYVCYMYMNHFVDWQSGACSFDSPEFVKLLEFCAGFEKEFNYDEDTYESEVSRIQSGKQLLEITTEADFQSFQMYEAMFGGKITYKGFPVESGVGNVAYVDSGLAMSTSCADKDGAWSFIRTLLTENYQTGGDIWSFPTNQAAFDKELAEAMEKQTHIDENGNEVEDPKGGWGWDDMYVEMYAVTQEQADRITALIGSTDGLLTFDTNISGIIADEAAAFFAGSKSAEDTAKGVQSRVAIYVSEQG